MRASTRRPAPPRDDPGTRNRLIAVAAELFADRGVTNTTIREICTAAGANVAAVNYHFGGKDGLYRAVVDTALRTMRETNDLSMEAGRGTPPEDRLRAYVHVFLERLRGRDRLGWLHKLMAREMAEPGEVSRLVMRQVIEPRLQYLAGVVGEIAGLPSDDPRVLRAVVSLQGQIFIFARPLPPGAPAAWTRALRDTAAIADHITDSALAAARAANRI